MESKNIIIQQPQPFDIVDRNIMVAGLAVGFEGTISLYISDGHYEIKDYATIGSTSIRQFQAEIKIPEDINFELDNITLLATNDLAGCEEHQCSSVVVPLIFAPRILNYYTGYWYHTVKKGETLSKLAQKYYNNKSKWKLIYRANINSISNPDIIYPGQVLRILRDD